MRKDRRNPMVLRKNECLIAKIFDRNDLEEGLVAKQLELYLKEKAACTWLGPNWLSNISDDKCIVIFRTVEHSKKCRALIEYGYVKIS